MGPTIATVLLRIPVPGDCRVGVYLARVQRQATEMIPYEQTGLRAIAKVSDEARQACDFQTLLVVQPSNRSSVDEQKQEDYGIWRTDTNQQGFTTYSLTIECFPMEGRAGLTFRASFDARVVESWRMERLLIQLSFLTQQLAVVSPDSTLAEMDTLPPQDKDMIWKWNAPVCKTIDRCVHDIIHDLVGLSRCRNYLRLSELTKFLIGV